MEQLHHYIAAARHAGHSDGQIRDSLVAAGWDGAPVDAALQHGRSPAHRKHSIRTLLRDKKAIGIAAAAALILLAAAGLLVDRFHPAALTPTPLQPSVTFYYDDGKTVLWQSNNPAYQDTEKQPAKSPYFVYLVKYALEQKYGDDFMQRGAWQVTTSLDPKLQAPAEKLVQDNYSSIQYLTSGTADEEATMVQDVQTGQIKAYVGGTDFTQTLSYGYSNYAVLPHQPGTAIYPFDYADMLEHTTNTGAGTAITDTTTPFPGYPCTIPGPHGNCLLDYDYLQPGEMPVRYALGGLRDIPAMRAIYDAAPSGNDVTVVNQLRSLVHTMGASNGYNCYRDNMQDVTAQCYGAAAMGDDAYLSLADEVHALSTFANNGKEVPQAAIVSIKLNGAVLSAWHNPAGKQVIRPDTAYIINDISSDPNASYLPGSCTSAACTDYKFQRYKGWHFAVDTGATNNGFDASMASWSSKYAVASWVGNHNETTDLSAPKGTSTEYLTEPLTRGLMEAAHSNLAPHNWLQPKDIKTLPAFVITSHIHYGDVEPSPATDLYPSWYKQ